MTGLDIIARDYTIIDRYKTKLHLALLHGSTFWIHDRVNPACIRHGDIYRIRLEATETKPETELEVPIWFKVECLTLERKKEV